MKVTFRTHYNRQKPKGKVFELPSETIEGQTLTIQELYLRAARNGTFMMEEGPEVPYMDVEDVEAISNLYKQSFDLTDLEALREHNKEATRVVNQAIKKQAEARAKAHEEYVKNATPVQGENEPNEKPKQEEQKN